MLLFRQIFCHSTTLVRDALRRCVLFSGSAKLGSRSAGQESLHGHEHGSHNSAPGEEQTEDAGGQVEETGCRSVLLGCRHSTTSVPHKVPARTLRWSKRAEETEQANWIEVRCAPPPRWEQCQHHSTAMYSSCEQAPELQRSGHESAQ